MRGRWRDRGLALVAMLAALGLLRSLLVLQAPAAADLPEPLRRRGPQLKGYRSVALPSQPARRTRAVAWGPGYRWRLLPQAGAEPLLLELVVRRSRQGEAMAPDLLAAQRLLSLGPGQQVALGRIGPHPALQSCLVGRGRQDPEPTAAVKPATLTGAAQRWRERFEGPLSPGAALRREAAIQAGLRLEERWECLQVTLHLEKRPQAAADGQLLAAWRQLRPQLQSWGERWDGMTY